MNNNTIACKMDTIHSWLLVISLFLYSISPVASQTPGTKPIINLCGGFNYGCAVFDNKQMKCWGESLSLGFATPTTKPTLSPSDLNIGDDPSEVGDFLPYIDVGTGANIDYVSCGAFHFCVKLDTGNLKCLGNNSNGQIGIGNSTMVIGSASGFIGDTLPIVNLGTEFLVTGFSAGADHVCAQDTGNKVKCYGFNLFAQLGYGDTVTRGLLSSDMGDNLPFVELGTGVEVASVHSNPSSYHNCVILSKPTPDAQKIKCWGSNSHYQLGYGDTISRGDNLYEMGDNLTVIDLGTESRVKQLIVGYRHTCAILVDDALKCFGRPSRGALGYGTSNDTFPFIGDALPNVQIDSGKTIRLIHSGVYRTCIVYDDMLTMKCMGENNFGELGQGDTTQRGASPSTMIPSIPAIDLGTGSLQIRSIYSGSYFNCVEFVDHSIKCFGRNDYGQLAIGSTSQIGDNPGEMGTNLVFSELFSPTSSPTKKPTISPTKVPTFAPTPPTTRSPTNTPTSNPTKTPTDAPITPVDDYLPPKADCYQYTERAKCIAETNGECGTCAYFSEKVSYGFRVRVNFVMDKGVRFIDFDNINATPPKTSFRDAVKAVAKAALNGQDKIIINRIGQIYQTTGVDSGYADFDFYFVDSDSNRVQVRAFLTSKPNLYDYIDDLNSQLNKKMKTNGRKYITGKINIDNLNIVDLAQGKGSCGCSEEVGSNATKMQWSMMLTSTVSMLIAYLLN